MLKLAAVAIALVTAFFLLLFGVVAWIATGWTPILLLSLVPWAILLFVATSLYRRAALTLAP